MAAPEERRAWRGALAITLAAGIVRLVVAALTPLFPDETYYWDWSRHLAPGYFDHPPMVALLVRAGTLVAGDTPLGVRVGCVVASTAGAMLLAACARRIGGARAAVVTAIVFAAMPLAAAGLILATPDAPLLATAAATLWTLLRVLEAPPRSRAALAWWGATGVMLGLALLSKYMGVLIPLGVFVAFVARRALRARLAEPGPWLAAVIALLVFSPDVAWNARHGWASYAFQLRHGFGGGLAAALNHELELLGGQAGLVSPVLFVLLVIVVIRSVRASSSEPLGAVERDATLGSITLTVFAFFAWSATRRRVEPNWPAVAYLPAVLLLAAAPATRAWRRWLIGGVGLAVAISLVTYVNAFTPILPVRAARDPVARSAGWSALGAAATRALEVDSGARTYLAADNYQTASELAFHVRGRPRVFSVNLLGRPNQYDFWKGFADVARPGDALLVVLEDGERAPLVDTLALHFARWSRGERVALRRGGDVIRYMRIWRLNAWRGTWPRGQIGSPP